MKKNIILLLSILFCFQQIGISQSIISNGEFTYLSPNGQPMPSQPDVPYPLIWSTHDYPEITKASGWDFGYAQNLDGNIGTPDLYSAAATNSSVKIYPNCSSHPCHYFENPPGSNFDLNKNYARFGIEVGQGNIMKGESLLGLLNSTLVPGESYVFKCSVISASSSNNVMVQFRNSTNSNPAYLAHTFNNVESGNITDEWLDLEYTFTVPQNTTAGLNRIEVGGFSDGPFGSTIFIDRLFLEPLWDGIEYPLNLTICQGESIEIPLYNSINYSYSWSPSNTLSDLTIANPIATPLTTTTYTCEVSYGIQSQIIDIIVVVSNGPTIDLEDIYIQCDGNYEEICAPSDPNYSYQWYGPDHDPTMVILLSESQCFTPNQTGNYTLFVTDENGCSSLHSFSVLNEVSQPILGLNGEICIGDAINIAGQGFDNPNYTITWFHNGDLVQQGGTTLQTTFLSGTITVEISYGECEPVSAIVKLVNCCPEDIELSVDCENQTIVLENLPLNWPIMGMEWSFNGTPISPQPLLTSSLNASLGEGTYGVTILYLLSNGKYCNITVDVEYIEANCCDEIGPTANAHFVYIEEYQTTFTDPYGNVEIPILCDFILDASNSLCEEEYTLNISELDPLTWTTTEIFPWTYFSGPAGSSIDLSLFTTFTPGQAYLLAFNVGPNGTTVYLPFIYDLDECEIDPLKRNTNIANIFSDDIISLEEQISVYPNPTNNLINIKTNFDSGTYQMYNIHGKILLQNALSSMITSIDLSGFNAGVYLIRIQSKEGQMYFKKVIKN